MDVGRGRAEISIAVRVSTKVISAIKAIESRHALIAERAEELALASKVIAGLASAAAYIAAPSGLTAVGASLGILATPVVVLAAPILITAAAVTITISAAATLYSSWRTRKAKTSSTASDAEAENAPPGT